MLVLFAFAVPGFVLKKLKFFGENATFTLSNLLLYVCQPALTIKAFCVFTDEAKEIIDSVNKLDLLLNFGIIAVVTVVSMFAVFGLCKLIFIKSKNKEKTNVYTLLAVFSNSGFLGVPFVELFADGDPLAVMYMMVFNIFFIILCWTLGVVLITGNFKDIKITKLIANPAIIANVIALIMFFVPQVNIFAIKGLEQLQIFPLYLSYMTAPLSMIIVGIRLADMKIKQLFCQGGIYLASALRLVVAPFLTFAIALAFLPLIQAVRGSVGGMDEYVFLGPVIAMAMAPAASIVALAERFNGDRETATSGFITSTLISVLVTPLVLVAILAIWGVCC